MKFNLNDNLNLKVKDTRKAQNTNGSRLMVHGYDRYIIRGKTAIIY